DPGAIGPDGNAYPRRSVFGRYVNEHLLPFLERGRVRHVRQRVVNVERDTERWIVKSDTGAQQPADIVVLASTHPKPSIPAVLSKALQSDGRLIGDGASDTVTGSIAPDDRVLIVGTGLTMADIVAALDASGHRGMVTVFSRRGLLSRGHAAATGLPFGTFTGRQHTALGLLRSIRQQIRSVKQAGGEWQWVIDAVRAQAQEFWPQLGLEEQRKIVTRLRPYWDAHRFRVAPQVDRVLAAKRANGTLEVLAASLVFAEARDDAVVAGLRLRGTRSIRRLTVDKVIVATGPAHGEVLDAQSYMLSLAQAGWIEADDLRLGLRCDRQGHAMGSSRGPSPGLFVAGPLARATFGELMGLPQVSDYALAVANQISRELAATGTPADVRTA
nr:FAD/NAD(P)-binding protein [Hyphomonas sp.]